MRSILVLILGVSLFVTPLAMAGGLSSSDSGFLFKGDQVSATTISSQEMQSTQGKQFFDFSFLAGAIAAAQTFCSSNPAQCQGSPIVLQADNSIFNSCSTTPQAGTGACTITVR